MSELCNCGHPKGHHLSSVSSEPSYCRKCSCESYRVIPDSRDAQIAALEAELSDARGALKNAFEETHKERDYRVRCFEAAEKLEAELAPFRAAAEKYKDACAHLATAQCCDPALDGLIRAALVENEGLRADAERLAYLADPMGADHSLWQDLMTHTHSIEEFRAKIDAAREKGGG